MSTIESRTVTWLPVHEYATALAAQLGVDLGAQLPYPGTIGWLNLADDSPAKKAAMLLAASHRVMHLEIAQEAHAQAAKDVAASTDWPAVAREVRQLHDARRSGARVERSAHV